eukprot:scaffold20325_cov130-Isochrysis_galbana.AAC.1
MSRPRYRLLPGRLSETEACRTHGPTPTHDSRALALAPELNGAVLDKKALLEALSFLLNVRVLCGTAPCLRPLHHAQVAGGIFSHMGRHLATSADCLKATFTASPPATEVHVRRDAEAQCALFRARQRRLVGQDLASLRYEHYLSESGVERVKLSVIRWHPSSGLWMSICLKGGDY